MIEEARGKFDNLVREELINRKKIQADLTNQELDQSIEKAMEIRRKFMAGRKDGDSSTKFFYYKDKVMINTYSISYGQYYPRPKLKERRTDRIYIVQNISALTTPFTYTVIDPKDRTSKATKLKFLASNLILVSPRGLAPPSRQLFTRRSRQKNTMRLRSGLTTEPAIPTIKKNIIKETCRMGINGNVGSNTNRRDS